MIRKLSAPILTALILLLAACSHNSQPEPDRPGQAPKEDPELSDASMRITGPIINFKYDDGGILFSRSSDGTISAIRVSDGLGFDYNPSVPSLKINGVDIAIKSAELLANKSSTEWHRISLADSRQNVYIVVSL